MKNIPVIHKILSLLQISIYLRKSKGEEEEEKASDTFDLKAPDLRETKSAAQERGKAKEQDKNR
jgi:hypothetical protein